MISFALHLMTLATLASHPAASCPDSVGAKPLAPFRITVDGLPTDSRSGGASAAGRPSTCCPTC